MKRCLSFEGGSQHVSRGFERDSCISKTCISTSILIGEDKRLIARSILGYPNLPNWHFVTRGIEGTAGWKWR